MMNLKNKKNKKNHQECFCALCRSPRVIRYSRRLKANHYFQILTLAIVLTFATYPLFQFKALFALPLIWATFEMIHKSLFRKDLSCPFCGFDPTWYKKDVTVARKQVEVFLKNNPNSPILLRPRQPQVKSPSLYR